jgi:hypothetical protein
MKKKKKTEIRNIIVHNFAPELKRKKSNGKHALSPHPPHLINHPRQVNCRLTSAMYLSIIAPNQILKAKLTF